MCGRFVVYSNLEQLKQHFPIDRALSEAKPNYNVAPEQEILTIFRQVSLNVLEKLHWGLVPHWAKDISTGYKMINARSETIATKPSFRDAFKKRRCLILADGFYEWPEQKGNKQPVSKQVNSVKVNDPSNIAGIPISMKQMMLFPPG
jgi:putative SOS response-associated peptidase YedK